MGSGPKLSENRKSFLFSHVGRIEGQKSPKLSQLTSAYRRKSKSFAQVTSRDFDWKFKINIQLICLI